MAGKTTDRKSKAKSVTNEPANFVLPDSLPSSEIDFPVRYRRPLRANWKKILEESNQRHREIEEFVESKREVVIKSPFLKTERDYIRDEVFVQLLPALEETLVKAEIWDAFHRHQCFFNGIDHIVQVLWNNNPRYPSRRLNNLHLFNMPWVRELLKEHPRPFYPKSWLWTEDYAATMIQKTVRQYFVQRDEEVQEMREFWRKLKVEHSQPNMDINPLYSKKFASQMCFAQDR